jgi:hypothetical protein
MSKSKEVANLIDIIQIHDCGFIYPDKCNTNFVKINARQLAEYLYNCGYRKKESPELSGGKDDR